jgi:Ca-dependent carbohydrate-binding module xylan-binding
MRARCSLALGVAALSLVLLGALTGSAYAQSCSSLSNGVRCEGETFSVDPSVGQVNGINPTYTSGGALLLMMHNGSANLTTNLPNTDTLNVRARGGQYCQGWPHMVLAVDGHQVMSKTVAQLGWQSYPVPAALAPGSHLLTITYDNDYSNSTCDRNLRVDYVDATDPPPAGPFRAFAATSPWNTPASQKGTIGSGNPYASQFTSYSSHLQISGTPDQPNYASPTFFAAAGDPVTANLTLTTDWSPTHDLKWDGNPIPIPSGAYPAPGSDGHMTIVSANRTKAWEFWRCTQVSASGITTAVIVQWDLTGPGYSSYLGENSARGSGTPLISTTLRADEALNGINHALGITVPNVSSTYSPPVASHSDGAGGAGAIQYGMLFVLRSDYPVPTNATVGVKNVIQALKTYGAYVVDQGASFEIDADSTHPDLWSQAGVSADSFGITSGDMRFVSMP